MKQKRMTAIAVACGLLCAVCVFAYLMSVRGEADAARAEALARYGGEQVEVCVATRDIAAGERIDSSAIETKLWVADLLPDGAVSVAGNIVGKTPSTSILKGEVLSERRFDESRVALDVPAGMEAISVSAKAVQAVGGAVRPGMHVDVYSSSGSGTVLLAQDALVLDASVADSGSLTSSGSGWITLALESERVQEVIAAAYKTDLSFALPGEAVDQTTQEDEASASSAAGANVEAGMLLVAEGAEGSLAESGLRPALAAEEE